MLKQLAKMSELKSDNYNECINEINQIARRCGLQEYTAFSRIWEYPWLWDKLKRFSGRKLRVLDLGSELSPFPWFLATKGFNVIVSDINDGYWDFWQRAEKALGINVTKTKLDAQNLDLPTDSINIYLSVSVIEHVPNKGQTIAEAARVLKTGGMLIMTFDVCEPSLGMTFPEWNGKALTMQEFDKSFNNCPWFEQKIDTLKWNTDDIQEYLNWHRSTAPHHNYVTGAAMMQRSQKCWEEAFYLNYLRIGKGSLGKFNSFGKHCLKRMALQVKELVRSFQYSDKSRLNMDSQTCLERNIESHCYPAR
jgi:ubiquinone/menaquinone biosynthesis C-methylase UbiE